MRAFDGAAQPQVTRSILKRPSPTGLAVGYEYVRNGLPDRVANYDEFGRLHSA